MLPVNLRTYQNDMSSLSRAENKIYNSEAALSYAVRFAYYAAQRWYTEIVELDSGKGYADVAYLPSLRCPHKLALLVELKRNKGIDTALAQILDCRYQGRLERAWVAVGMTRGVRQKKRPLVASRYMFHGQQRRAPYV